MNLYDYQEKFVSDIRRSFAKNKRVIGQLPTGGGKGVVLSSIAMDAIRKGSVPCISVHRIEIFEQIYQHLRSFGIMPSVVAAGQYPMGGAPCYLSMVETVCRRMDKGLMNHLNVNFFIMDEVHHGGYYKLINQLDCHILGMTATPKSTGNPELKEYFDAIVCGPKISELQALGKLSKFKATYSVEYDFSKVKMKGKDYDERALFAEFKKPKLWNGAVESYMEHAKGRKALCFCVNVEHSNATANQFRDQGIKAAHIDGTTDKETRSRIFDMYRQGEIEVLCNVGIATTGTDLPDTECIIQNFATVSIVKHVQTLGRGARVADDKNNFIVIDMGRNYIRHGEFGEDIDWEHIFHNPSAATRKESKREKRECGECGAVIRFHLQRCPYCGDFISKKEIEDKVLKGATVAEVKAYRLKHLSPHLRRPIKELNDADLQEYGRQMGYKPSWYWVIRNKLGRK